MAKTGVSLSWGGLDKAISNASRNLHSRRKALLAEVGEALVSGAIQRFQDSEDPEGTPWKPSKRARATGGKTLVDKAYLRNNIGAVTTADSVHVGSNLAYSRIHQLGGKTGRGHVVTLTARPYLGFSKDDKEEMRAIMRDYLRNSLRRK